MDDRRLPLEAQGARIKLRTVGLASAPDGAHIALGASCSSTPRVWGQQGTRAQPRRAGAGSIPNPVKIKNLSKSQAGRCVHGSSTYLPPGGRGGGKLSSCLGSGRPLDTVMKEDWCESKGRLV
eukprot:scaffold9316_cov157-Isochrysis_galbana.AAC.5